MAWGKIKAWDKARTLAELVRYEHTVFALPFAYLGAFLAAGGWPPGFKLFWITTAMVGARTAAMGVNRLVDRYLDARNPRTANRHLPRGTVRPGEVSLLVVVALGLLALSAYRLNLLCVAFLPLVVPLLIIYPYTKRFTWGCHFFLGAAQFFAPFGGWIAVTARLDPAAAILGAAVGLWVAGFDIIYATMDYDFDRRERLYSLPARFGLKPALRVARGVHLVVFILLLYLYPYLGLGGWYLAGVMATGALLLYEHSLVSPGDLSRVNTAFFNVNGVISVVLFLFSVLDTVLKGG